MDKKLSVLHLEGNVDEAELVHAKIEAARIDAVYSVVQTREAFVRALEERDFDLILSDFSLPSLDGKNALAIARKLRPDVPFVFVSGPIDEEAAIESLVLGATDYVLKNRLVRLVPAVKRALRDAEDARKRKRSEEELRSSEERFKILFEFAPDAYYLTDKDGTFVHGNRAAEQLTGYNREELIGKNLLSSNLLPPSEFTRAAQLLMRSGQGEPTGPDELTLRAKSGAMVSTEIRTFPVTIGKETLILAIGRDISERKRSENALRDSEEKYRSLVDHALVGVYKSNLRGDMFYANQALAKILEYGSPAEMMSTRASKFYKNPKERERMLAYLQQHGLVQEFETELVTKTGATRNVIISSRLDNDFMSGMVLDIGERKRADIALKDSEEKYRSLFERNLAATFVSTMEGKILDCNPAYLRMFGFDSREQAEATNIIRLYTDPLHREHLHTTLREQHKVENLQLRMMKLDGTPMYIIANIVGRFDEHGQLVQKTGYLIDDTKRHRLEKELIQSQKLESLGILAGGIAHDFNNILGILMGHVSLLDRIKDNPEMHRTSLEAIDTALKRGVSLVRQLLTFARKSETVFESVVVNDIVKEILRLIRETFPKTIEIVTELRPKLPAIVADGSQIHQVLLNLCVNGRDAMPAGGRLRIQTSVAEGALVRQRFPSAVSDNYIAIEVRDTGTGMDEATKTRLFEPFFTTKETGKGTGLGLAVVFGVVQTHKGYIDVESTIGAGSAFRVYLPVEVPQFASPKDRARGFDESMGGNESILVVEDEPLLYETTKLALVSKGYKVLYAKDGFEALDEYRQHFKEIDLVLTDMDLPKLGGEKLAKALLEINPKLKVMFASGYVESEVIAKLLESGAKAFLPKPYEVITMLAKVREVLDAED